MNAARRGVDVRVITNGASSSDQGFVAEAARYFYDDMLAAGVRIYEKQGSTLHSKTASFDSEFSIVGSYNLNGRSAGQDSEVVLGIESKDTAAELEQRFTEGLAAAREVTQTELDAESSFTNLKQWTLSRLAWTF